MKFIFADFMSIFVKLLIDTLFLETTFKEREVLKSITSKKQQYFHLESHNKTLF